MSGYFDLTLFQITNADLVQICIRLMAAFASGAIIGINRELKRRGAGIKTHSLVCTSAALVMMTGEFLYQHYGAGDVARLGAQVISGVGFLGVGTIMVTGRNRVKGLTTAATLWTSACIGLAIGSGFLVGAGVVVLLVMLDLVVMNRIDDYLESHSKIMEVFIDFATLSAMPEFVQAMRENNLDMTISEMNRVKIKKSSVTIVATIKLNDRGRHAEVMNLIGSMEGINFYNEL